MLTGTSGPAEFIQYPIFNGGVKGTIAPLPRWSHKPGYAAIPRDGMSVGLVEIGEIRLVHAQPIDADIAQQMIVKGPEPGGGAPMRRFEAEAPRHRNRNGNRYRNRQRQRIR